MKMKLVTMNSQGRVTVSAQTRKALGLEGESQFIEEIHDGAIVLRPAAVVPKEDAWAYTPEHRTALAEALSQVNGGKDLPASRAQITQLLKSGS
jgi:antitoxin PrlF